MTRLQPDIKRPWLRTCCLVIVIANVGCTGDNVECEVAADCLPVEVCVQGLCVVASTEPDPVVDAGPPDAGVLDAGSVDAGVLDAGPIDAGPIDAGPPCIDVDLDGRGVDCALGPDCDDNDEAHWMQLVGFEDADEDTVSLSTPTVLCTNGTLPAKFAAIVSDPPDCDDTDGAIFMPMDLYFDGDSDGAFAGVTVAVCTDGTIPAGAATDISETPDCDDADPRRTPGATEICDALDNDCSGFADDGGGGGVCTACLVDYTVDPLLPYYFCRSINSNWGNARAACASASYKLAVFENQSESALVSGLANTSHGGGRWWIGLGDSAVEGEYVWVDGAPLEYETWGSGEPNNNGNQDCVQLRDSSLWHDTGCGDAENFICEATPAPFVP